LSVTLEQGNKSLYALYLNVCRERILIWNIWKWKRLIWHLHSTKWALLGPGSASKSP